MSFAFQTKTAQDALVARSLTALRLVVAFSLAAACVMALAEEEPADAAASPPLAQDHGPVDIAELERTFWACDRAATAYGLVGADATGCSIATELLKQQRFNGDFAALLAWWQAHKAAAYAAQAGDEPAALGAPDAEPPPLP